MKQEPTPVVATKLPNWLAPAKARKLLHAQVDAFVAAAARGVTAPDEPAPALALQVTAGLGKTATALRVIADHAEALLARGHVLIYVPTLDLAERARADFRRIAPQVPSRVVRGRAASRPDDRKKQMCEQAALAQHIADFVPSVTQALCRAEDPERNFVLSECAVDCPYLAQKDAKGAHVVFLSHSYLTLHPPVDSDIGVALRVIDEKFWTVLARTTDLSIDDFMRVPPNLPQSLRYDLARAKAAIVDGLQRDLQLHDHLAASGMPPELLKCLAEAEGKSRKRLELGPWQSTAAVHAVLRRFDAKAFGASLRRQMVLSRLSEKPAGHCNGLCLVERRVENVTTQAIQSSYLQELPRDAPVLLLDADADPEITERLTSGARFSAFQSPPVADVVQISDLTLSSSWLLDENHGKARRAGVLGIIEREVVRAAGGGVLVVATRKVLAQLHADAGQPVLGSDEAELCKPLLGAVPRWFGPRMQGVNDFEEFATVIIVGRLQPPISDVEADTRAVFGSDDRPIQRQTQGELPAFDTHILMSDGTEREAAARMHPDPRAQAILAQTRECGTLQAIARLRLVAPRKQKRVVILSNLPLPGFPITRLVPFAAVARGLEREPDIAGFLRMEAALKATMGKTVLGARLSAQGLAQDLPLDFCSESSGRGFRRGRPTADLYSLCQRIAAVNGWPISRLLLRKPRGGTPVPAIVLAPRRRAVADARLLWPGTIPCLI